MYKAEKRSPHKEMTEYFALRMYITSWDSYFTPDVGCVAQ